MSNHASFIILTYLYCIILGDVIQDYEKLSVCHERHVASLIFKRKVFYFPGTKYIKVRMYLGLNIKINASKQLRCIPYAKWAQAALVSWIPIALHGKLSLFL